VQGAQMTNKDTIKFDTENRGVIIPIGEEQFAEFIAGLLGKPQTIENKYNIAFDLELADIESCFHLVDQRVTQQNRASLVQFSAEIVYEDNSSLLLNSIEDFVRYREVRNIVSTSVSLSWTYLIIFQNKSVPEKKVIELTLATDDLSYKSVALRRGYPKPLIWPIGAILAERDFNVLLRIEHTARTWGTDIENLLGGQIRKWECKDGDIEEFVRKHSISVSFAIALGFFSLVVLWLWKIASPIVKDFNDSAARVVLGPINDKLDFLIRAQGNETASYAIGRSVALGGISLIVAAILWTVLSSLAEKPPGKYLVLSEASKKRRERLQRERLWTWRYFIGSAIASTVAGVLSRYIFALL
jgi:hypothetical protein